MGEGDVLGWVSLPLRLRQTTKPFLHRWRSGAAKYDTLPLTARALHARYPLIRLRCALSVAFVVANGLRWEELNFRQLPHSSAVWGEEKRPASLRKLEPLPGFTLKLPLSMISPISVLARAQRGEQRKAMQAGREAAPQELPKAPASDAGDARSTAASEAVDGAAAQPGHTQTHTHRSLEAACTQSACRGCASLTVVFCLGACALCAAGSVGGLGGPEDGNRRRGAVGDDVRATAAAEAAEAELDEEEKKPAGVKVKEKAPGVAEEVEMTPQYWRKMAKIRLFSVVDRSPDPIEKARRLRLSAADPHD